MPAGHLVARLDPPLHRQVHLDHLQNARCEIVARGQLGALLLVARVEIRTLLLELRRQTFQLTVGGFVVKTDIEPLLARKVFEVGLCDLAARLQLVGATVRHLAEEHLLHALVDVVLQDAKLIVQVLLDLCELRLLDLQRPCILFHAVAREHLHVDDRTRHAGRYTQGVILHIRGLLTEDGTQQLLLRRQLGLALGRHLAHQDVAGLDLGTDVDDAGLVQLGQRGLAHVGDIAGDLLRAQLGVPGDTGQLLDMDRGVAVFLNKALGDKD